MTEGVARRVKSAPKVSAADLHNWKLLAAFRERMEPLLAQAPVTATEADPRRTLHMGDYFAMVLFAMLNPVIATTRSLCASSSLERMQAEVCGGPVSLGSFSEMQAVADPELLAGLLRELGDMALPSFGERCERERVGELIANDGTLLRGAVVFAMHFPGHGSEHALGRLGVVTGNLLQIPEVLAPMLDQHAHTPGVKVCPAPGQIAILMVHHAENGQHERIGGELAQAPDSIFRLLEQLLEGSNHSVGLRRDFRPAAMEPLEHGVIPVLHEIRDLPGV